MTLNEDEILIHAKDGHSYILNLNSECKENKNYFWYSVDRDIFPCICTMKPTLAGIHEMGFIHEVVACNNPDINVPQF